MEKMLGRFRSALYTAIGTPEIEAGQVAHSGVSGGGSTSRTSAKESASGGSQRVKYAYQRPIFLQLFTDDEIQVTADHLVRPIIVPRDVQILPWFSGYAEAINAGKSLRNEDQAAFHRGVLRTRDSDPEVECGVSGDWEIPYIYFGIFDGHAGSGCAVTAANELHQVVHKKLMSCLHHLVPATESAYSHQDSNPRSLWYPTRDISAESLIIGALEAAFWEMDAQIGEDKKRYKMLGGCTVLVSLFILGKLYVANAGDSRACLCRSGGVSYPMSFDFTPVSERQRLQQLGYQKPHLMGSEYTHLDFCGRKPLRKDVGKRMLYRDAHMTGWAYKEITPSDLRFPIVYGEGKRSRLLATIGVTRGFGDHDLKAQSANSQVVFIKPFLTPQPEVRVLDIENEPVTESDVLVMATDGLWDVVSNDRVAAIVDRGLNLFKDSGSGVDSEDARYKYRFISIAQDLVMAARGKMMERNWKQSDNDPATIDDISAFAIPLLAFKEEYKEWKVKVAERKRTLQEAQGNLTVPASQMINGTELARDEDENERSPAPAGLDDLDIEDAQEATVDSETN